MLGILSRVVIADEGGVRRGDPAGSVWRTCAGPQCMRLSTVPFR